MIDLETSQFGGRFVGMACGLFLVDYNDKHNNKEIFVKCESLINMKTELSVLYRNPV